jgi:hypothetical protein
LTANAAKTDEIEAARHVAYVAAAFLSGTADHNALRAAVEDWQRRRAALSKQAFRQPTSGRAASRGEGASQGFAKQTPLFGDQAEVEPVTKTASRSDEDVKIRVLIALRALGLHGKTEHRLPAHAETARSGLFPADVVVVVNRRPVVAIEAKHRAETMGVRQRANYARCGIPAVVVTADTVDEVARAILEYVLDGVALPAEHVITAEPAERRQRTTWLTPFGEGWATAYEGTPPWGQLGRYLKPLVEKHGPALVLERWVRYLTNTEARFASPARFASTFGAWGQGDGPSSRNLSPIDPRPGEDVDGYIGRLAAGRAVSR